MKKPHRLSLFVACSLLLTAVSGMAEEQRYLVDKNGKTIDARLISHPGAESGKLLIETKGKEFLVDLSIFRKEDQKDLREWIKNTPPTVNYELEVSAIKTKIGKDAYGYNLNIENSGNEALSNFKIKYRVYMKNRKGKPIFKEHQETVEGPLVKGKTASLNTKSFDPNEITLKNKNITSILSSFSSNDKKKTRSGVVGVLVRVFDHNGKVVKDWRSPGLSLDLDWDPPKSKVKKKKKPAVTIK